MFSVPSPGNLAYTKKFITYLRALGKISDEDALSLTLLSMKMNVFKEQVERDPQLKQAGRGALLHYFREEVMRNLLRKQKWECKG